MQPFSWAARTLGGTRGGECEGVLVESSLILSKQDPRWGGHGAEFLYSENGQPTPSDPEDKLTHTHTPHLGCRRSSSGGGRAQSMPIFEAKKS